MLFKHIIDDKDHKLTPALTLGESLLFREKIGITRIAVNSTPPSDFIGGLRSVNGLFVFLPLAARQGEKLPGEGSS